MNWDPLHLYKKLIQACLSFALGLVLIFNPFGQGLLAAEKATMSGDFIKDTVSVAQSLKETIALADDAPNQSDSKDRIPQGTRTNLIKSNKTDLCNNHRIDEYWTLCPISPEG